MDVSLLSSGRITSLLGPMRRCCACMGVRSFPNIHVTHNDVCNAHVHTDQWYKLVKLHIIIGELFSELCTLKSLIIIHT